MIKKLLTALLIGLFSNGLKAQNPWNGKLVLQGFYWDYENSNYVNSWANYPTELSPRLRGLGIDNVWIPPTVKNAGANKVGYSPFDHYDLVDKYQKGSVTTRVGTKDDLLRMVAVMHANWLGVIQDVALNHTSDAGALNGEGGQHPEPIYSMVNKSGYKNFRYVSYATPATDETAANYLARSGKWSKNYVNFHPNQWRNGKVGLGNNPVLPQYILDVGARARIQHKGNSSAGIYFNTSQQTADAFVGMKQDDQVGFYQGNSWNFWVTADGNCFSKFGSLAQSDRRQKRNFTSLANSLTKITNIKGYNYYMIDPKVDQSLQTGVIAQEVEEIFPELVKTDKEGMKAVNYTGFIPHLIESIKELKVENEELKKSVKRIESLEASLNSLIAANKTLTQKAENAAK